MKRRTKELTRLAKRSTLSYLSIALALCIALEAGSAKPLYFDVRDLGEPNESVPVIKPWRTVQLDGDYGGQWVVAADLDGDGAAGVVSCENVNNDDGDYTSTA